MGRGAGKREKLVGGHQSLNFTFMSRGEGERERKRDRETDRSKT